MESKLFERSFGRPLPVVGCSIVLVTLLAAFGVGCGAGSVTQPPPVSTLSGNTAVTVMTSGAANDRFIQFAVTLNSLSLMNKDGKSVSLLNTPQTPEFLHVNGTAEPWITLDVPQDIYTSATASVAHATVSCATIDSSSGNLSFTIIDYNPSTMTVTLPNPITITGGTMGLSLDLVASQSISLASCSLKNNASVSVAPTFNINPITVASTPANSSNGKATDLLGLVSSIDAGSTGFVVTPIKGSMGGSSPGVSDWKIISNGSTVFQGITSFSQLVGGMPVDMDVAIQSDGSLLATRVAVYDTDPTNLSIGRGEIVSTNAPGSTLAVFGTESEGRIELFQGMNYTYDNAIFRMPALSNLQNLPFSASFTAANMVAGQRVLVSTHSTSNASASVPIATITLLPQTINGTVQSVSTQGGFTQYSVALADYDLFPVFDPPAVQLSKVTNPNLVTIYADAHTQMLNSKTVNAGDLLRFTGAVFNDNGTLRMDCAQVSDGITE